MKLAFMVSDIPCFSCREPVHCCTEEYPDQNLIMITFHDARRICDNTGLKISDFAEFRRVKKPRVDELDDDEKYYFIKNMALFMKKSNNKCVFLDDKYMCKIHKFRPCLCRMYPFWYEGEGDEIKIVRMNDRDSDSCPVTKNCKRICQKCFDLVCETKEKLRTLAKSYDGELECYQKYKKDLLNQPLNIVFDKFTSGKY